MVIRYVISFMNNDGMRQMAYPCQGRHTLGSKEEAQELLKNFLDPTTNHEETLKSVFGKNCMGTFEVSAVACYDGHFDPMGCFIKEELNPGQVCVTGKLKEYLDSVKLKEEIV